MKRVVWKDQLAVGRVFELRSASKRYPAPCALVINSEAGYGEPAVVEVTKSGTVGQSMYRRGVNPNIYVPGYRGVELTKRIARRRRGLERFDYFDIALIRHGYDLEFTGRISARYSDMNIPTVVPAEWTVFWIPAYSESGYFLGVGPGVEQLRALLRGAWHFESYGGSRHLGYKFGRLWATRHTGARLTEIRKCVRSLRGDVIEQPVKVTRWNAGGRLVTAEIRRECPALGSRWWSARGVASGEYCGGTW